MMDADACRYRDSLYWRFRRDSPLTCDIDEMPLGSRDIRSCTTFDGQRFSRVITISAKALSQFSKASSTTSESKFRRIRVKTRAELKAIKLRSGDYGRIRKRLERN